MFLVFESSFTDNSLFWLLTTPFFQLKSCFFFANHFSSCSETLFQFFFPNCCHIFEGCFTIKADFLRTFSQICRQYIFFENHFQ